MKVKSLIEIIKNYEEFDIRLVVFEGDDSNCGACLRTFELDDLDIGYADKIITLSGEEV